MKTTGIARASPALPWPCSALRRHSRKTIFPPSPWRVVVVTWAGGGIRHHRAGDRRQDGRGPGQQIIIENKPGAQSIIAAEFVAKSGGLTVTPFLTDRPSGPMTMNPTTYAKLPYAPLRDFVPLSDDPGRFP